MRAEVKRPIEQKEYWFKEGCYILENGNDNGDEYLSIARARVKPKTATSFHMLKGVTERYIILSGSGRVEIGDSLKEDVEPGDIVRIPDNTRQRIINTGEKDLIFYAVCAPPFTKECYISLKE